MIGLDTIADLIRDDYFNLYFNFISLNHLFSLVVWLFCLCSCLVSFEHEVLQWICVFNTPAFLLYATLFLNPTLLSLPVFILLNSQPPSSPGFVQLSHIILEPPTR